MKMPPSLFLSLLAAGSLAAQEAADPAAATTDAPASEEAPDANTEDAPAAGDSEAAMMERLTAAAERAEKAEATERIRVAAEREKAKGEEMEELKTAKGRVFNKVTISKVDDLGISIRHEAGTARVPFEQVDKELQKRFGYDPDLADEQARLEREKADAFARAAIAALRASKEENKPGSAASRPSSSQPSSTGNDSGAPATSGDIRVLEQKVAVIQKGIAKLEVEALEYEEKAANLDRRSTRTLPQGVLEDREGARSAPKSGAEKWRAKAYAVYDEIEKAKALISKYRKEIRALKRDLK